MSQQAFSKLRMNFDYSPFVKIHNRTVQEEYSGEYDLPQWNGYHVFGIDGTYLQLPRTREIYDHFGIHGRPPQCPNAGVSVLFDVMHGWAVDPIITKGTMDERIECMNHVDHLRKAMPHIAERSVIVLDRGYPSMDLIRGFNAQGMRFVMRAGARFIKSIVTAPIGDSIIEYDGVTVRVIRFHLPNGDVETLVTNLFDIDETLFPELYAMRWGIETAYFKLKRELCVERFSGKTVNSIYQDFWASMALLNAVAVFQAEADAVVEKRHRGNKSKHTYRARTSDLIVTLRDRFIFAVYCGNPDFADTEIEVVIRTMARSVSAIRPNRSYPRNFKLADRVKANLKSCL